MPKATDGLYRRNGIWYIDFMSPSGKRIRRSTGTQSREAAEELRDKLRFESWRTSRLGETPKRLWDEAALRWLREKSDKKSIQDDISRLRMLSQLRGIFLHHIDSDLIMSIVEKMPYGNSTKNRYLALIRSILKAASTKWKWLDTMPHIELYKETAGRVRWLRPDEAQRLIDSARPTYFADLIVFSLNTGLRQANVLHLKWSQIDLDRKVAWYYPDETKAGQALGVALNETAIGVIKAQQGKHPVFCFCE